MINPNQEDIKVRIKALEIAIDMKPLPQYTTNFGTPTAITHYDLLKEAESIYQWLVKL